MPGPSTYLAMTTLLWHAETR